jgi:hypothetical protein
MKTFKYFSFHIGTQERFERSDQFLDELDFMKALDRFNRIGCGYWIYTSSPVIK